MVFFNALQNRFPSSNDTYAVNIAPPFIGVVVDDADYFSFLAVFRYVAQNHLPRRSGADQHDPVFVPLSVFGEKRKIDPVRKTNSKHQNKLDQCTDHIIGNRHADIKHKCCRYMH